MHLLIWFSRSVPVNGAALSIVGLFYGPIWPATLNWANDMLPQEVRMVTMAIMYVFLHANHLRLHLLTASLDLVLPPWATVRRPLHWKVRATDTICYEGILPFVAGIILNKKGAYTLPYINTALTGLLGLYWVCLPIRKRYATQATGKV
jgi:hypothetical protein